MTNLRIAVVAAALLAVAGCGSFGPTSITHDRFDYSGAQLAVLTIPTN